MTDLTALSYTAEHEWIAFDGDVATVGITDYAQGELGDIVYLDLPKPDTSFDAGAVFGTIEAVKAVIAGRWRSSMVSPVLTMTVPSCATRSSAVARPRMRVACWWRQPRWRRSACRNAADASSTSTSSRTPIMRCSP